MTREEVEALLETQAKARARAPAQLSLVGRPAQSALTLTMPLPPSWNAVFRAVAIPTKTFKRGQRVWTARVHTTEAYETHRLLIDAQARREAWPTPWPKEQMLRFSADVYMPRAGCDLDDRLKVLFDSLEGYVYENDTQVAEYGRVRRFVDGGNTRVEACFEPIDVDKYGVER